MGIVAHIKNLLIGMGITGKHLGRHAITIQYPEEKMEMFERSRGVVVLLSDKETGELNCTACVLCEKACPTRAITIEWHRDDKKRKHLDGFVIDFGLCCFCGLCEEACNFCAIKMANKYEFSTWDKDDIVWDVNKLQDVGRDVPYEDTRKKKKPKPAAQQPAAESSAGDKDATVVKKEATPPADAKEEAMPPVPPPEEDKTDDQSGEKA